MKLSAIFEDRPDTWGYRGDPYFWDYLKDKAENIDAGALSPDGLEEWIKKEHLAVSGKELSPYADAYVEAFAHGGMSSGGIAGNWWTESGIPLLKSRLRGAKMDNNSCLLDHDFMTEYELSLSAWGGPVLCESALLDMQKLDAISGEFKKKYRRYPKDISLLLKDPRTVGCDCFFITIEPAFLEKLETLKELILPDSVTEIKMTPKIETILSENRTLIRGEFDSFAERFADLRGLNFKPADFVFADFEDTRWRESTTLELVFTRKGDIYIKENRSSPGSSSSHTLGGSFTHPLPAGFYKTMTAQDVAEKFESDARRAIIEDGRLAAFIEKAGSHGFYTGKN